jgi:hypothetical protein
MKTKFSIIGIIAVFLYSCQEKSSMDLNENIFDVDSSIVSNTEQKALIKWLAFNIESDSIIQAADMIIKQQKEEITVADEGKEIERNIAKAQFHLDQIKKKVKYIKDYEANTEKFEPIVIQKLDSLKLDYLQEKLKLESALYEFKEYRIP